MVLLDGVRTPVETRTDPASDAAPRTPSRRARAALVGLGLLGMTVLFLGYLRMSRTQPVNADGASNALQAWDLLHGNVFLAGWTLSDVSFYPTELIEYALIELWFGLRPDVVHLAAALTYTLLIVAAALVARGRATGVVGAVRFGVPIVLMLAPQPWHGYEVVLLSPDHTGSALPVLVVLLVLDRLGRPDPRWWLPALVAVLLAWGQVADPLVLFIGALPVVLVSGVRLWRDSRFTRWRGLDGGLLLAGVGSVLLAQGFLWLVRAAGGFVTHAPHAQVTAASTLGRHLRITVDSLALLFGGYLTDRRGPAELTVGTLHLLGLVVVGVAVIVAGWRLLRRAPGAAGDRVADLLALAVLINISAFVVSTLPGDLLTARQLAAVLPLGAALAGRVCTRVRLARLVSPVLAASMLIFAGGFVGQATGSAVPAANQDIATWLAARGLGYGLGGYWSANNITLATGGRVQVVPVIGVRQLMSYRWESRADWYDPVRHDARFVVVDQRAVDRRDPGRDPVAAAIAQFGPALEQHDFGRYTVLVYAHNLLVGLPAYCGRDRVAPEMAQC